MKCPICDNNKDNSSYFVKEMQQGLREEFEYIECSNCGCLFIKEIPNNMSKYYDIDYIPHNHEDTFKNRIIEKTYGLYIANNRFIKYIVGNKVSNTSKFWNSLVDEGIINKNSSILDIGCGDGKFLTIFKKGGFKDLTGVDLFIDEEKIQKGIKVYQSSLEDFKPRRKYDLIISNHAVEHMDNQIINLRCFEKLLNDNGTIVIRIPVKSKPFWDKYGVNWYQIDAPRHFYLHTLKSFKILCESTNLIIDDIIFDSRPEIFLCCEKYSRNISVKDSEWNTFKLENKEIKDYEKLINMLNENNEGDQAIFILKLKK